MLQNDGLQPCPDVSALFLNSEHPQNVSVFSFYKVLFNGVFVVFAVLNEGILGLGMSTIRIQSQNCQNGNGKKNRWRQLILHQQYYQNQEQQFNSHSNIFKDSVYKIYSLLIIEMQHLEDLEKIGKLKQNWNKAIVAKVVKRIRQNFAGQTWDLGDRKFKDLNAKEFLQNTVEIYGVVLSVDYNKNPSMFKQISFPKFSSLQTIFLGDNLITSLQGLAFLNMPSIRRISLNDNLISNIKSMAKCNFPKLEYLSLNGNRVFLCDPFQKSTLKKVQKIKLLDQLCKFKAWENMNVLWMMKSQISKESGEVSFDPKFVITPELCLIKLKLRRKNYAHPCSQAPENNYSPLSPLQCDFTNQKKWSEFQ